MNDGFQIVKSKRRNRQKVISKSSKTELCIEYAKVDFSSLLKKIEELSKNFRQTEYFHSLTEIIQTKFSKIDSILCFGLGNFSDCTAARTQLAALLSLKDYFKSTALAYDPKFVPIELSALKYFDVQVSVLNEEGKHLLEPNRNTLAFFPHCPKQLVNNFLWANWCNILLNCVVISNSFSNIVERNTKSVLSSIDCLRDILKITTEVPVPDIYEVPSIFNDLSVHIFSESDSVNCDFWVQRVEPVYPHSDIELITKEVIIKLQEL